jgi:hypothetical protein
MFILIKTFYASFPFKHFSSHFFCSSNNQTTALHKKYGRKIASFKTHKCYFSFYLHNPFPSSCCFQFFTANFFSLKTTGILCLAPLFTLGENHTIYYQRDFSTVTINYSQFDTIFHIVVSLNCLITLMICLFSSLSLSFICFCSLNPISSIISCHSLVILKLLRQ